MYRIAAMIALIACSTGLAQNLLLNPSFTDPPVAAPCVEDWQDVANWAMTPQGSASSDRRNGDYKSPPCPGDGDDTRASLQGWGTGTSMAWQTVAGLTTGSYYKLSGRWYYGADAYVGGRLMVSAQIRTGSDPNGGIVVASTQSVIANGITSIWLPFQTCGQLSIGTEMTVVVKTDYNDWVGWALHFDNLALEEVPSCVEPNRVDSISPAYGTRGNTVDVTITGFDFTRGPISVKLNQPGASDISATNITVQSPTVITCKIPLSGAPNGRWNVMVSLGSGEPLTATLPNGFMVVLPTLSNGSFELPTAAGGCPVTPLSGHPTDWLVTHGGSWGDAGYDATTVVRDRVDVTPPSCPPPAGQHYASTYSIPPNPNAQPESWAYQTLAVDNTKTYTVWGYFAGAGDNTVTLDLLNGDELAAGVPDSTTGLIHNNGPAYDWTFGYAQGKPTGNLMTVRWRVSTRNAGPHVAHADAVQIGVCTGTLTATSILPANGDNTGVINSVEVIGSGFSGGSVPKVMLSGAGLVSIQAASVTVDSDTHMTCSFNLAGQPTGIRHLIVFKDACVSELADAFLIVTPVLANGGFELPDPGAPVDCTAPSGLLKGVPAGWSASLTPPGSLDRDHHVQRPVSCPSSAGGHYGSLTTDRTGELMAYQTLRVAPTAGYTLSGLFAGGDSNSASIRLIDGTLAGTELASTVINDDTAGASYDWRTRSVSAYARSGIMTAVWKVSATGSGLHGLHADGLTFTMTELPCNDPFADADGDHDVDQADFSVWQLCYTGDGGTLPTIPTYCRCFDRENQGLGDGDVDFQDFQPFEACASGPGITANTACDN
jgi:hypothetical protein